MIYRSAGKKKAYRIKEKPEHKEEISEKLPVFLRGRHFNHWRELLNYLITITENE
ncbi:hypothetical protein M0P98_01445 [bacterium]|nr:hypothetical protein [bacterium]